ncbi:MAG: FMN-binding protein [Maribacter sp.]|nr:FMN-binding protein [Maribacter sp.]
MQKEKSIFGLIILSFFFLTGFGLPKKLEKRVHKELEKTFQIDGFTLTPLKLNPALNTELPKQITEDNFFKVTQDDIYLGYMFVDKAASKTAEFDYLVVFDKELCIVHSKVLIYREEYGGEIGSKRWLRQFNGKTGKDRVNHETNIDGIAGATISVRSMTIAIDKLLQTIGILQENQLL